MVIYIAHSKAYDYKKELYHPIRNSIALKEYEIILPHEFSDSSSNSRDFYRGIDLIIAECSYAATGEGIELGWGFDDKTPIYAIHKRSAKISGSVYAVTNKENINSYDNSEEMVRLIQEIIENDISLKKEAEKEKVEKIYYPHTTYNTEMLVGALFKLGFERVDSSLFTHTQGAISSQDKNRSFTFGDSMLSKAFNTYINYTFGACEVKAGYTIDTNISDSDERPITIGEILDNNTYLEEYLTKLDFGDIIKRKADTLGISTLEEVNPFIFCPKEIEILNAIHFGSDGITKKLTIK